MRAVAPVAVACLAIALSPTLALCEQPSEKFAYDDYMEMRAKVVTLYEEQKYEEMAELLEWARDRFPDHLMANSFNLALAYCGLENHEKAMDAFEYALERDVWFGSYSMGADVWAPLRELERFAGIKARNEAMRQEAQKKARPEQVVVTPDGFDEAKAYPLFIALHGGGGNIAEFKDVWTSAKMKSEFITAYLQSSLVVGMDSYSWTENLEVTRREIADAYRKIIKEYRITEDQVIVGGFSSGGVAALDVALSGTIPMAGFIVLCPAKPESFSEERVAAAKERGLRGTLLTTEMDQRLADQEEMAEILKRVGFPHQFIVTPDIGHWIPEDLDEQIDRAIEHVRGE